MGEFGKVGLVFAEVAEEGGGGVVEGGFAVDEEVENVWKYKADGGLNDELWSTGEVDEIASEKCSDVNNGGDEGVEAVF